MATEKILIFDEAGNAKRMKVRIARFLDNEPVTASDKENIRTTLDVDDSLSGTFTTPLSVTSASDSSFTGGGKVGIGTASPSATAEITSATTNLAAVRVTRRSDLASTYAELGTTGGSGEVRSTDNLVLSADFDNNGGSSVIQFKVDGTARVTIDSSGNVTINNGNLVLSSGAIDFGSAASGSGTPITNGGLLDDYEAGSFVPQVADASSGGNVGSAATAAGE